MANIVRRRGAEGGEVVRGRRGAWDPFRVMQDLLQWDPFPELQPSRARGAELFAPPLEIRETRDAYVVRADLPGVEEKDVEVTVTGNTLTLGGRRHEEEAGESDRVHACEPAYGSFARSVFLPEGADPDGIRAEMKNGVLSLTVPKRPEVQPRKISIGEASKGAARKS